MKFKDVKSLFQKIKTVALCVALSGALTGCSFVFSVPDQSSENTADLSATLQEAVTSSMEQAKEDVFGDIDTILEEVQNVDMSELTEAATTGSMTEVAQDVVTAGETIAENGNLNFESAQLVRVVDGDTIVVEINGADAKVRMIGVDTPESVASKEYLERTGKENTEEGFTASDYTKELLSDVETVYLEKDVSDTDRYGRLLRYVWLEVPEEITKDTIAEYMVNGILLVDKIAKPVEYKPDTKYAEEFEDIYEEYTY